MDCVKCRYVWKCVPNLTSVDLSPQSWDFHVAVRDICFTFFSRLAPCAGATSSQPGRETMPRTSNLSGARAQEGGRLTSIDGGTRSESLPVIRTLTNGHAAAPEPPSTFTASSFLMILCQVGFRRKPGRTCSAKMFEDLLRVYTVLRCTAKLSPEMHP